MKYIEKNPVKTETFHLDGVEKTDRNGHPVVVLYLRDMFDTKVIMSNFESYWNASLESGLDFETLEDGAMVDVKYSKNDKFTNFVSVSKHYDIGSDDLPF